MTTQVRITKQDAQQATQTAWNLLHEADHLNEATHEVSEEHTAEVLTHISHERVRDAFNALDIVDDYFHQQPKKRTKKTAAAN